jgi:hypothetical protein
MKTNEMIEMASRISVETDRADVKALAEVVFQLAMRVRRLEEDVEVEFDEHNNANGHLVDGNPNPVREIMLALESLRFACEHAEGKKDSDRQRLQFAMSLGIRTLEKHKAMIPDFQKESYWQEVHIMTSLKGGGK